MAINYAKKYSDKVVERFSKGSLTDSIGLCKDYEFKGAKSVVVYSIPTMAMNDYTRSGASRYGTPAEIEDTIQEMVVAKDRSFTGTVDKMNLDETGYIKEMGKISKRQTDEVITPELDKYRLNAWASATGTRTTGAAVALSRTNIYDKFTDAQMMLDDSLVPEEGRVCFITPKALKEFKLDTNFVKATEIAQNMLIKGQVGEVDGVKIIKVPSSRMPLKTPMLIMHPSCSCSPVKLNDLKMHDNPPGISGKLIEGRIVYDCFVFDSKANAIIKHMEP